MHMIKCEECGRRYDYDDDGFCPHCGAFNQPSRTDLISNSGEVTRVDGISEAGHANSFAHEEFHAEERERRRSGLDRSVKRVVRHEAAPEKSVEKPTVRMRQKDAGARKGGLGVLPTIIVFIVLMNLLSGLLRACGA